MNDIESSFLDHSHAVRERPKMCDAICWKVAFERAVLEKEQLAVVTVRPQCRGEPEHERLCSAELAEPAGE